MKTFLNLQYGETPVQSLDLYLPETDSFPLFLYFHGGGLEHGNRKGAAFLGEILTAQGVGFASADYRMYPDAKFPDYIEDAAASVAWLLKNIPEYGNCSGLYVGGSSAGGYLSMMLCFDTRYLTAQGVEPMQIAGYLHDAGQPTAHFNMLSKQGVDGRRVIVDETAPMYFVGLEKEYPPMLFLVSDNDMENRYEQTMLMLNVLKHFEHSENVFLELLHGKHCEYVYKTDENGEGVFGNIVLSFIDRLSV